MRSRRVDRVGLHVGERRAVLAHELAQPRPALLHVGEALRIGDDLLGRDAHVVRDFGGLDLRARAVDRRSSANGSAARPSAIAAPSASCAAPSSCVVRVLERGAVRLRVGEDLLLGRRARPLRRRRRCPAASISRARSAGGRAARARERSSPPISASSAVDSPARARARRRGRRARPRPAHRRSGRATPAVRPGASSDWCACWPCRSTSARRARRARPRSRADRRRSRACDRRRE